ncbi:hypothetical protein [Salinivibrio socompensis]|nr:hypothetical protein [Salinivibrio socompensis]
MDKKETIQTELDVMIHLLNDELSLESDAVRCWMISKLSEIDGVIDELLN